MLAVIHLRYGTFERVFDCMARTSGQSDRTRPRIVSTHNFSKAVSGTVVEDECTL